MKILVDENIPRMTIQELISFGHDVKDIRGTTDEGMDDDAIWEKVIKEKRLLITTDKGFGHFRNECHTGILIVLLKRPNRLKIHERIMKGIHQFTENEWQGKILVMRDTVKSLWEYKVT